MSRDFGNRRSGESRAGGGSRPRGTGVADTLPLEASDAALLEASPTQALAAASKVVNDAYAGLPVLRTTMRRLGYAGIRVFDAWMSSNPAAEDAEWANDHIKPLLDGLLHLPYGDR